MTDENVSTDPHAADPDENPEEHIGEEIPDPWDDSSQTDWPDEVVELGEDQEPEVAL